MRLPFTYRRAAIASLQAALLIALGGAGWIIYRQLPSGAAADRNSRATTTLQIVLRPDTVNSALDVAVNLYQVDIVAVRHEFFTEQRAGKRFDDFLKERISGRAPINARLDKQGQAAIPIAPGSWLLHATLPGDEQLEWRLPVKVSGTKQIIELTTQNAYTRSKSF